MQYFPHGGGLVQAPLRQRRTHGGPDGQARGEGGLQGVVDVRVPLPGAGRGLIGLVELVSPHPGGVDEELLGVVDPGAVVVLVVLDLDLAAAVVEQGPAEGGGGADPLAGDPVHAFVDDRLAGEVRGVDEAGLDVSMSSKSFTLASRNLIVLHIFRYCSLTCFRMFSLIFRSLE